MGIKNRAWELAQKLSSLHEETARLSKELSASFMIETVWPEAFKDGNRCTLCARETVRTMQQAEKERKAGKVPELKRCYLRRSDGIEFELSADTYWTLKEMDRGLRIESIE